MTMDPLVLIDEVDRATERLLTTVGELDDDQLAAPSLLPGWSRGHVVTHIARNADGLLNLLIWARTGKMLPQYASAQQRSVDIEVGAGRPAAVQLADVSAAAVRLATVARD